MFVITCACKSRSRRTHASRTMKERPSIRDSFKRFGRQSTRGGTGTRLYNPLVSKIPDITACVRYVLAGLGNKEYSLSAPRL